MNGDSDVKDKQDDQYQGVAHAAFARIEKSKGAVKPPPSSMAGSRPAAKPKADQLSTLMLFAWITWRNSSRWRSRKAAKSAVLR
jgi:hypothetical protein